MPALLVDTKIQPAPSSSDASTPSDRSRKRSESRSPNRPPVSPITPTVAAAQLAPIEPAEARQRIVPPPPPPPPRPAPPATATFRPQPASVPISDSENPDAIALRSAISILQLQREKSKRDLKALEDLKSTAVSDPQAFIRSLQTQRSQSSNPSADILTPTLSDLSTSEQEGDAEKQNAASRKDSADVQGGASQPQPQTFPAIPQPQNVIRCPPVNWAKYHIVGEPLDKLHEEQRRYPGSVEPPRTHSGARAPPHTIASPYSPFTDGVSDSQAPPQSWRPGFKKSPS